MKDRILVTGSAGLVGSHISDKLTRLGYDVLGVDNLSGGYLENTKNHQFLVCDLRFKNEIDDLISYFKPKYVYHLAASAREIGSLFQPVFSTENNLLSYINLLNACIKNKFYKMILFSSMAVMGDQTPPFSEEMERKPEDIYAINKAAMEKSTECLSDIHDFNYTIVRPHNIFGERQICDSYRNVFRIWANKILNGEKQINVFGDGEQTRAFSYIDFSLPCYIRCLEDFTNGQIYNIGGIKPITLNEAAKLTLKVMGVEDSVKIVHLPPRPKEVKHAYCTYEKSVKELGYKEDDSLENCLRKMADWCKKIGPKEWFDEPLELENDKTPEIWRKKERSE
jgi:UDP-glucose 4-epimerase